MAYYITYGAFERQLREYYLRTGRRMQIQEMTNYLFRKNMLIKNPPKEANSQAFENFTDERFDQMIDSFLLAVHPNIASSSGMMETDLIPDNRDVLVMRRLRHTRIAMHVHNYFEINFVITGNCMFYFEKEKRILKAGEICIISQFSNHDLTIDDESIVYSIMIRKSTFHTAFFSLMSQKNILSYFFRSILQDHSHPNYLLFYSGNIQQLKHLICNAFLECYHQDEFSNHNCINWIQLFFSQLLRCYSKAIQFYNYQFGTDFSLILQYIQHNYQTLTLAFLADFFHYSKPHLSTLIKQNTGYSFTSLVRQLRMADAVSYLENTQMKISEIANCVGYHSSDHFSRVFRSAYKMSPLAYRKKKQVTKL